MFSGFCQNHFVIEFFASNALLDTHFWWQIYCIKWMPWQRISQFFFSYTGTMSWKSIGWNILLDLVVSAFDINVKCHWCLLHFLLFQRYQWSNWGIKKNAFKARLYQQKKVLHTINFFVSNFYNTIFFSINT